MTIEEIVNNLSLEEMVGQVLCYDIYGKDDPKEIEEILKNIHVGGIYLQEMTPAQIKMYTEMAQKYTSVPVIVAGEVEGGPEMCIKGAGNLPHQMAMGAADDPELVEEMGRAMGNVCRKFGFHWPFAPVVDLNYNFRSSESNIRTISDSPKQVVKIAGAFIRGIQHNHNMVACAKHFPGCGVDERNGHFVTLINDLSKEEWMATYGYVYKELIKQGVPSIMVGHIALPAFQKEYDETYGWLPAVLSKSLMTDLLKGELGFDGCVVSDAMSMIGVAAAVPDLKQIATRFLNAGGDMILFPEPSDYETILEAVKSGEIPLERLKDAVTRVLRLKERANLFGTYPMEEPVDERTEMQEAAQKIADKSIKIVRNKDGILPVQCTPGMRVLMVDVFEPHFQAPPKGNEFAAMREALEKNGCVVDELYNPKHKQIQEIMDNYDLIVLCCRISSLNYHGATTRLGWNHIMVFWRGYILQHPKFVFVSFGDPYKLFDAPYLKTYVNAFSDSDASQRAFVKVLLGQIEAQGKNPVAFKGYFDREVE